MQIQITITPSSFAEAAEILDRLGSEDDVVYALKPAEPAVEKPKRARKTKAEIEAEKAAETSAIPEAPEYHIGGQPIAPPPAAPAVEDAKIVSEPALDYERDVMPALKTLAADPVTLKQVVAVLGKYGVKRGQDVKAEDLAAFKADIEAIGKEEAGVL